MIYTHRDEHVAIGSVENVLVVGWLGPPRLAAAIAFERATRALAAEHPAGVAHFNVIAKVTSPAGFEDAARKRIIGMLHDVSLPLVASVTVFDGGGFVAAAIGGVLSSLTTLARTSVKIRLVTRMNEGEGFVLGALHAAKATAPVPGRLVSAGHATIDDAVRDGLAF